MCTANSEVSAAILLTSLKFLMFFSCSFRNSFSVDTSQRISSALWAMKLLEASRTSNANSYQDLLVKVSTLYCSDIEF